MINTVTIDNVVKFSPQQVHDFADVTKDTNPIHQLPTPVIPGMQLALFAKKLAESTQLNPKHLKRVKISCSKPAYAGNPLRFCTHVEGVPCSYQIDEKTEVPIKVSAAAKDCAEINLLYSSRFIPWKNEPTDPQKYRVTEQEFKLDKELAHLAGQTIGKDTQDYTGLAFGALSYALLEHGKDQVKAKAKEGLVPVYLSTEITMSFSLDDTLRHGMTLKFQVATRKEIGQKCCAKTVVTADECPFPIYHAESKLVFAPYAPLAKPI